MKSAAWFCSESIQAHVPSFRLRLNRDRVMHVFLSDGISLFEEFMASKVDRMLQRFVVDYHNRKEYAP